MDNKDAYWSFFHELTGRQVDRLTFVQAEFVYDLINPSDYFSWLVWYQGATEWLPLENCAELHKGPSIPPRVSMDPTATASATATATATAKDENTNVTSTAVQKAIDSDKRLTRRFTKAFKAEIQMKDGTVFSTMTVNASMGGMEVKEALPATLGKTFEVTLSRVNGNSLKVFCSIIKLPQGHTATHRLRIIGTNQEGLYRSWLLDSFN